MPPPARTDRSPDQSRRALRRVLLLGALLPCVLLPQAGCKLISQRTFDPGANRPPVPKAPPPAPAPKLVPPLATVRFGAPADSWRPALAAIVREALSRKPDALFTVQVVVPATGTPAQQAAAIGRAVRDGGQPVAQCIEDAGARAAQIDMEAATGAVAAPVARVTAR